tara:strand:+ start:547 stop:732 length:186 start_codon:yes stop_codon:yes gene_type:complete
MEVGDMVFDASLGRRGIIVASFGYSPWIGTEETEWEHEILYDDGMLDSAYERELEVISESR